MRFSAILLTFAASALPGHAFFRMACPGRLVTERMDPIVAPNGPSSHVHTISGGNGLAFQMDYNSTQQSTCSSCPIKADLSNYWTPKLYYQMQNGSFMDVPQSGDGVGNYGGMTVYYLQRGGPNNDKLKAFPAGFRMLAGDPMKRSYTSDFAGQAVSFVCLNYSSTSPYYNKLPDQPCPDGLRAQVFFPSCWDGVNLDSANHKSHMAYPTQYSYDNGPCPSTHPVHMISIFYEIIYSTIQFPWWVPDQGWQPFVFSTGDPTGYGFHGDFLNGWDVPTLQAATDNCTNDSGNIQDCPVFKNNFFTNEESQSCIIAPRIHEQTTGVLSKLPGCNPVQYANATMSANCNDTSVLGDPFTYYKNVTGWQYIGCGKDASNRTFKADQWWSNDVTIEGCMDYCKSRGYSYAGLEYSTQCFCDNTLPASRAPTPGVLGNCFSPCAGDSSEYCGGANRLSIYYNPGAYKSVSGTSSRAPRLALCPNSNGTIYNATNSAAFQVQCGIDRVGGDIGMTGVQPGNITACIEACASLSGCSSVALSGSACYMKTGSNLRTIASGGINGAALISAGVISNTSSTTTASNTSNSSVATGTSGSASQSSAAASAPAASSTLCPGADGQVINNYTVRCTSDSTVGSYTNSQATDSYLDCMTACDNLASSNCIGFVYVGGNNGRGSGTCWLKTAMGSIVTGRGPNYLAAYKPRVNMNAVASSSSTKTTASASTSPTAVASGAASTQAPDCPGSNSTYYQSSTGAQFLIECGIDHYGGDIGSQNVNNFQQCIEACAADSQCVDVSLSGVACYLKGSVGATQYSSIIKGARLMINGQANAKFKVGAGAANKIKTVARSTTKKAASKPKARTSSIRKKSNKASSTKRAAARVVSATSKTSVRSFSTVAGAIKSPSPSRARTSAAKKTTTRTSASPSSTVTKIECPYTNNTIYYDPASKYEYMLECGVNRIGELISNSTARSLKQCIGLCSETDGCVDVTFNWRLGRCHLKGEAGTEKKFGVGFNGARLLRGPKTSAVRSATSARLTSPTASVKTSKTLEDAPVASTASAKQAASSASIAEAPEATQSGTTEAESGNADV